MSTYRSDQFINLLRSMDARKNDEEDQLAMDENTIQDLFFPVSEKLTLTDAVTVAYYDPSTFVWGNGSTISAGWDWNGGAKWNAS